MKDQIKTTKILVALWFGILMVVFSVGAFGVNRSNKVDVAEASSLEPALLDSAQNDYVTETYHWPYILSGIIVACITTGGLRYLAYRENRHENPETIGNSKDVSSVFLPGFGAQIPTPNHHQASPKISRKIKKHNNGII